MHAVSTEDAEVLALQALTYLAASPDRLGGFLQLTGLTANDLRAGAGSCDVQVAVLDHLMRNESDLLVFASERHVPPQTVVDAYHCLADRK